MNGYGYFPHAALLGVFMGLIYFKMMDDSIPENLRRNCSYTSGVVTDILAFVVGGLMLWRGYASKDYIVFCCGIAMTVEHVVQLLAKRPA